MPRTDQRSTSSLARLVLCLGLPLAACAPGASSPGSVDDGTTTADLNQVPGTVSVNGSVVSVEDDYLPRVVQCENPGAPTEALRLQAIAARTYLTYRTRGQSQPHIADGQGEQVYTCNANKQGALVPDAVRQAVDATRGQIVTYQGSVIAGFFVAGAIRDASCQITTDPTHTEKYVTINQGRSGASVHPTSLGNASDPANRGAMGQNLSTCLARHQGLTAAQLVTYFYGIDIRLTGVDTIPPIPATPSVPPGGSTDPTAPSDPANTGSSDPAPPACWSYTLQRSVEAGACVQSNTNSVWYQCDQQGNWDSPVDPMAGTGPIGPCTSVYAL